MRLAVTVFLGLAAGVAFALAAANAVHGDGARCLRTAVVAVVFTLGARIVWSTRRHL